MFTRRQAELLTALQHEDGATDRQALAEKTGKDRLSPNDIKQLGKLADDGYISVSYEQRGIAKAELYTATAKGRDVQLNALELAEDKNP